MSLNRLVKVGWLKLSATSHATIAFASQFSIGAEWEGKEGGDCPELWKLQRDGECWEMMGLLIQQMEPSCGLLTVAVIEAYLVV